MPVPSLLPPTARFSPPLRQNVPHCASYGRVCRLPPLRYFLPAFPAADGDRISLRSPWKLISQLPLAPRRICSVSHQLPTAANARFLSIGSCSARTVSLTTSVCSRTTTASANGGRLVRMRYADFNGDNGRNLTGIFHLQTSRSNYLMYPYLISVYGLGAGE